MKELRWCVRSLLRARWFTAGAVLTFALGIGVNLAVVASVDPLLFRPLPYREPDRLFFLQERHAASRRAESGVAPAYLIAMRDHPLRGLGEMCLVEGSSVPFSTEDNPDEGGQLRLASATASVLATTGLQPLVGRGFSEDDVRNGRAVVLLNYNTWRTQFGLDAGVTGRHVWLDGKPYEIAGVLPDGFVPPLAPFDPAYDGLVLETRSLESLALLGSLARPAPPLVRLRDGVSREAAQAELDAFVAGLKAAGAVTPDSGGLWLAPAGEVLFGALRPFAWLVLGAAGIVLLVACVNLAMLTLARSVGRQRESAVRLALGASRLRLVAAAAAESVMVCLLGAGTAALVFFWGSPGLAAITAPWLGRYDTYPFTARTAAFGLLAAVSSGLVVGTVSGLRALRVDILHVVQGGSIRSCGRRVGRGVIAGETVLGVVLLVLAVATLRSLVVLARTDLGFTPDGLYLVSLRLPPERDPVVQNSMYRQALDAVRRNPTVEAAAGADAFFVTRPGGRFSAAPGQACCRWQVTDDFFRSFRIPIFAGREFTEADMVGKAQVAILTTRGARLVWPDLTPEQVVGQTLRLPGEEPRQVIGVVGDVRRGYAADVQPGLFLPVSNDRFRTPWLVARLPHGLGGFRMKFERDLREAVGPAARVMRVTPLAPGIDAAFVRPGWRAALFGLFALVALLVATTGLYSAAAFEATRRRYEIGVRIALGASPGAVRRAIMVFVVEPVVVGLSIGLPIAWGTTRVARVVDVGHAPGDALPFGVAALVLLATAVVAGWLPARRAGRLDPKPLLNSE